MNTPYKSRVVVVLITLMIAMLACALPGSAPQPARPTATATVEVSAASLLATSTATPTAILSAGGGSGGESGPGGSSGGSGSAGGGGSGGGSSGGTGGNGTTAQPTQLIDLNPSAYIVTQIETLGGESISGNVCDPAKPFNVLSVTPKVTFTFYFAPLDAQHGNVSYAYTIESAGESHDAKGKYSISPQTEGALQVSLSISDHVVFHGFDGNIPLRYKFNLVPSSSVTCPPVP